MKVYLFILISFFLAFCNSKNQEIVTKKVQENKANYSNKVFFEFDKVEHFHLKLDRNSAISIFRNKNKTETEKLFSNTLLGFYPKTINESELEEILLKLKFKKTELDSSKLDELKKIFSEKDSIDYNICAIIPIYFDIFVFKMNGKTNGIAEICFENGSFRILGTDKKTEYFGQYGDLEKLQQLIK